jgi:lysophospholipase L1-like esterase
MFNLYSYHGSKAVPLNCIPLQALNRDTCLIISIPVDLTIQRCTNNCIKLLLFGANDACLPHAPTGQYVPLKVYKQNLQGLITHPAVVAHRPKIILVTPPPIDENQQEEVDAMRGYPLCRRADVAAEYAEAARQVGAENGDLLAVDLWSAVMAEAIRSAPNHDPNGPVLGSKQLGSNEALVGLAPDGLHFGSAGYSIFIGHV